MLRLGLVLFLLLVSAAAEAADAQPQIKPAQRFVTLGKKVLELPPTKTGCYAHVGGVWAERPCLTSAERGKILHPEYAATLFETTPSRDQEVQWGAVDIDMVELGGIVDVQSGGANQFSLQLNTNTFIGSNGHTDWVQFTYQTQIVSGDQLRVFCIWNIDLSTTPGSYENDGCMSLDITRPPQKGDLESLAGYAVNGGLQAILVLPGATGSSGSEPDAFATSAADKYGLGAAKSWTQIGGGLLGSGNKSYANLSQACLTTTLRLYLTDYVSPPPLPFFSTLEVINSAETNNLAVTNQPVVAHCDASTQACQAEFHLISTDWTAKAKTECYPHDGPPPKLSSSGAQAVEDDSTTQNFDGTATHICKDHAALIGIDIRNNRFLCSNTLPAVGAGANGDPFVVDAGTHKDFVYGGVTHTVHVCPPGMVMVGWNQEKNWLICGPQLPSAYLPAPGFGEVGVDGPVNPTEDPEPDHPGVALHACDRAGYGGPKVLSGLKADENAFICTDVNAIANLK